MCATRVGSLTTRAFGSPKQATMHHVFSARPMDGFGVVTRPLGALRMPPNSSWPSMYCRQRAGTARSL